MLASVPRFSSFQTARVSPMESSHLVSSHASCKTAIIGKKITLRFKTVIQRIAQMMKMNLCYSSEGVARTWKIAHTIKLDLA